MEQGNDEQVASAAMAQARAEVAQMSLESLLKVGVFQLGRHWKMGNPMPLTSIKPTSWDGLNAYLGRFKYLFGMI